LLSSAARGYKEAVTDAAPAIRILERRIERAELARLVKLYFHDMVKYVVDIRQGIIAIGGELHADAEQILLQRGARQCDLWGANYYPGLGREQCIEFTALINIRPSQDNPSMEIMDQAVRDRIRGLTYLLVGEGESL
jgi:hypothetical protein